MKFSIQPDDLSRYVARQMSTFFPDREIATDHVSPFVGHALARVERCFSRIKNKYFCDADGPCFDHRHTDQYSMFLYLLGNSIHRLAGDADIAARTFMLNKALHAIDVYYQVELPEVFYFQHPVGTVLGRAQYGQYFAVYQRCTIGGNLGLVYPTLGPGVILYGGSAVIGGVSVGANCAISAGTIVIDQDVPPGSIVFGRSPAIQAKPTARDVVGHLFRVQ